MEKWLLGLEEGIILKLFDQLSADQAIIDRYDQTIQQIEASINHMQTGLIKLKSTGVALTRKKQVLKLKMD